MEQNETDFAYRSIKSKRLSRAYLPGYQFKKVQLCKEIGLTRTPIPEAIIRIEREGLLRTSPKRGAFVIELTAKKIEDLFKLREAMEAKAITPATLRASRDDISSARKMPEKPISRISAGRSKILKTRNSIFISI